MYDDGKIDFFAYIHHLAEDDETKDHFHVIVFPNDSIDTAVFLKLFNESDPTHPDKPLSVLPWSITPKKRFGDWYLYSLHDTAYIRSHRKRLADGRYTAGEKKYKYDERDFVCSDRRYLQELVHQIDLGGQLNFQYILSCAIEGVPLTKLLVKGIVNQNDIGTATKIYQAVYNKEFNQTKGVKI